MSRTLPALFLLLVTAPPRALAQDETPLPQPGTLEVPTIVTADEAVAMDRVRLRETLNRDCPAGQLDEEVVVCGRRPGFQRYRVPMAGADVSPGTRERAGDAQLYAMEAGNTRCSAVGRDQQCGGGLDVIALGFMVVQTIVKAVTSDD